MVLPDLPDGMVSLWPETHHTSQSVATPHYPSYGSTPPHTEAHTKNSSPTDVVLETVRQDPSMPSSSVSYIPRDGVAPEIWIGRPDLGNNGDLVCKKTQIEQITQNIVTVM